MISQSNQGEDGMINATQMCKAGGKLFAHWKSLDSTKKLINVLIDEDKKENIAPAIIKNCNAGNTIIKNAEQKFIQTDAGRYGGSWIHPDLAVQLAQWISPRFAIQVSRWIRELTITGSVKLGYRKK